MHPWCCLLVIAVLYVTCHPVTAAKRKWDGLRVTWGPNIQDPKLFIRYPRTETEAIQQGFRKISDCDLTAKWRGKRYVKGDNYLVIPLYDVNGYIAGIQTLLRKEEIAPFPPAGIQPPFLDNGDTWVITAYFTDPAGICTSGRSAQEFERDGTGTGLYLQNSSVPEQSSLIPSLQVDMRKTSWSEGGCLPSMGVHFYLDLSLDKDCDTIFPATVLYNGGQLTAFAWTFLTDVKSEIFEHPRAKVYPNFMIPVPTCMYQYPLVSTMHVYLTDDFTKNRC